MSTSTDASPDCSSLPCESTGQSRHVSAYTYTVCGLAGVLALVCSIMVDGSWGNLGAMIVMMYGVPSLLVLSLIAGSSLRWRFGVLSIGRIVAVSLVAPVAAGAVVWLVMAATPSRGGC